MPKRPKLGFTQLIFWGVTINLLSPCQDGTFLITLVALPTGLGKTLIAALVMYNYFRWFLEGKIVFSAPSRPLVTQQIKA